MGETVYEHNYVTNYNNDIVTIMIIIVDNYTKQLCNHHHILNYPINCAKN